MEENMKPEERVLNALIEGIEATGEIITPKERRRMQCLFNMGYCAGHAVSLCAFSDELKETLEETIEDFITNVNQVTFAKIMLKEYKS